ncbi:MAG TPA: type II CAAX endopeptidase family protein [Bacteroidota bacterium]|nr:type II CAAX endopeptidase family protein [Bacteroidota bacterium]
MSIRLLYDRHGDLRGAWKIAAFSALALMAFTGGLAALRATGVEAPLAGQGTLLGAALLPTWIMTRLINRKPVRAVGLWMHAGALRDIGAGCLLGFLMMAGIAAVLVALGDARIDRAGAGPLAGTAIAGVSALTFASGAMAEELLFRGYAFQTLIQGVTFLPATLAASALFALAHAGNPHATPFALANVGLAGILFSFAYMKTRSLWLPAGLHFAWNFSQTALFGFPTSGIRPDAEALFRADSTGPAWIGGGEFGPEGGALATIALVLCTWYILKAPYVRTAEGIVTLDSIEDLVRPPGNGAP